MTDDPAWLLAQHVCRIRYGDLPPAPFDLPGAIFSISWAACSAAAVHRGLPKLFAVLGHWGGREESRVLLRATRLPAAQAALLNAAMGHALDFHDTLG